VIGQIVPAGDIAEKAVDTDRLAGIIGRNFFIPFINAVLISI
jgi:hypothetical protein